MEVELERIYVSLSVDPRAIAHLAEEEGRPGADDFSHLLRQRERQTLSMAATLRAVYPLDSGGMRGPIEVLENTHP